mmetsp:Transcript_49470/g.105146  ORF Transcript_49470/g.105146 Transcript_49470/m.105146 type:complete len:263 (+) Transcript_49470:75-863(+)
MLELVLGHTSLEGRSYAIQNCESFPAITEINRHFLRAGVKDGIQQVPLYVPTETDAELSAPREIDGVLVPYRPVQLALERVEDQIHLVQQQHALLEQLHDFGAVVDVLGIDRELGHHALLAKPLGDSREEHAARGRGRLPPGLGPLQVPHHLDELQHERLDARGRRADDGLAVPRLAQLHVQVPGDGSAPVEGEREDGLADDGRELLAHDAAGEVEERVRDDLGHERFPVRQDHREERRDHRRLPGPHDHLVAHRLAVLERV